MVAATGAGATGSSYNVLMYEDAATGENPSHQFPTRLLGHVLLSEIPDEGLREAIDCLAVIWDEGRSAQQVIPSSAPLTRDATIVSARRADPVVLSEG